MSLEKGIVDWIAWRPAWQRAVLRRVAAGEILSDQDYDKIVDGLLGSDATLEITFGLEQFPQVDINDPPVSLVSIADPKHVNALTSESPLTFERQGLTIIYGDNGSGKSGYARLLKRIARARSREDVLSDVFRDSQLARPMAALTVTVGDVEKSLTWPDSPLPELQRMLFYDEACGDSYIATEADFPYRPSALFVMDGLIDACVAVRARIDTKLGANLQSREELPAVDEDIRETDVGKFLVSLSSESELEALDILIQSLDTADVTVEGVKAEELRLQSADTGKERQKLTRQAEKLESVRAHLETLYVLLGDDGVASLDDERGRLRAIEGEAALSLHAFVSEPLPGVGTPIWKGLWDSARRFSLTHAFTGAAFPVVTPGARCVLCQQVLEKETQERLARFERFVQDDTQRRLREARSMWETRVDGIKKLHTTPETVEANLNDLEAEHMPLAGEVRSILAGYATTRQAIVDALSGTGALPRSGMTATETMARLDERARETRTAAEGFSNPELVKKRLIEVTKRRKELELLGEVKKQRPLIAAEIVRLIERAALEIAKSAAATGPITKQILELSEESITEVVRDTFTRETDRLRLERVTIARTRADRGALLHQPKLVGARQDATLPRVFSEGERTALGLAAFFTEAHLDSSKSALILDDPVSSLDHIRRGLVALRIAELAATRQVVVFTHDVAFVADLKREAKGLGVLVGERSVTRARGGEKKPGACGNKHPWKAKDVTERLGDLRNELAHIKRDSGTWYGTTYEKEVASWAGNLSETWERIFSQEIVGQILAEGGLEVRPNMVKLLARFTEVDEREFQASYSRISQWAKRHDKGGSVNYVAPEIDSLERELGLVTTWFNRVKAYKN